ncbi:hypothetical protein ACRALDRAFT_1059931 [Sodiomyces alcalophilus JCM 7366]|uniref:uncharacterized protein n=1 Tax=Sodiomyces alcalophilus JCM 7366 TaxID=591952 RepID=UPI0039B56249
MARHQLEWQCRPKRLDNELQLTLLYVRLSKLTQIGGPGVRDAIGFVIPMLTLPGCPLDTVAHGQTDPGPFSDTQSNAKHIDPWHGPCGVA